MFREIYAGNTAVIRVSAPFDKPILLQAAQRARDSGLIKRQGISQRLLGPTVFKV